MIEVKIINKIEDKVKQYQEKTGCTKTWLSKKMGYKTKQAFDGALNSKNPTISTLEMFAQFFKCDIKDLYKSEVIIKDEE